MKTHVIKPFDLWPETVDALARDGVLLGSVGADATPNLMTIGWLTGGIIWSSPVLIVMVRPSRHTFSRLEQVAEFTVGVLPPSFSQALRTCGTVSGRDGDKFKQAGLTPAPARKVKPPLVQEAVIHYECRVVHRNDVDPAQLSREIMQSAYPAGDFHRVYFGKVVSSHALPDARQRLNRSLM